MPRGMDERFDDPSDEGEGTEADGETPSETPPDAEPHGRDGTDRTESSAVESASTGRDDTDGEPLNIREDWDSTTIYVEPDRSEEMEVTFARLKKQLKRDDVVVEKNKHFYRGVFEVAFDEHREETTERIRELAERDGDQ